MQIKQVIVIRKDLNMRRGKEIAQGSHASMAWLSNRLKKEATLRVTEETKTCALNIIDLSEAERKWLDGEFTKVCVYVNSEQELMDIYDKAKANSLEVNLITDAGKTEFKGVPTKTCLAIGPDYALKINVVTGKLELY